MSGHENERWGDFTEWVARIVFGLTKDRGLFHDARDENGIPVEVKSCKRRTGRRDDHGKYFIRKENHEKLRDEGGYYIFVLYDPCIWKQGPVLEIEKKPAEWLDSVEGYGWTENGTRRGERVKRPPWPVVFSDPDLPDELTEATA